MISSPSRFDFDGCLANTPLAGFDPNAWKPMFPNVYATLTKLHAKGAHVLCQNACIFSHLREFTGERIVIVTNESIERFKSQDAVSKAISKKIGRLTGFCTQANVPCLV